MPRVIEPTETSAVLSVELVDVYITVRIEGRLRTSKSLTPDEADALCRKIKALTKKARKINRESK